MRIRGELLHLSASDLANHLGCRHLTALDHETAHGLREPPSRRDPRLEVLQQRGFQHEAEYLEHLRSQGLTIVNVAADNRATAAQATVEAMKDGADVIVQATLADGPWFGRADILRRVSQRSDLGGWSYQVTDTKLARETRAGTILQLCLYSDIVGKVQGRLPELMCVVPPGTEFEPEVFRVSDHIAYYRLVRARLADAVAQATLGSTYPEPVPQCDICRWWPVCDRRRHDDDHLSLVAGISGLQRRELASWGVETLAELAEMPLPLQRKPSRGSAEGLVRVREQARVQLEGRQKGRPDYELLPREPDRGLARLPEPSPGDIFFDIEGDAFVGSGGLEYLLGWVVAAEDPTYHTRWASDATQERASFEAFIDLVMERWAQYPDLHIYHFAPYEPGAIKRLMGRYATRENEVDRMLRAELFVDLYGVSRQAIRAGVERYSIKNLEQFYGYERKVELRDASMCLHILERALELGQLDAELVETRATVEAYNRDDCLSTLGLRNWLERLRTDIVNTGEAIARPTIADGAPSAPVNERQERMMALMDELLKDVPVQQDDRSPEEHARWLLAHMLGWHNREARAVWWEFFRLRELGPDELLDDDLGLSRLEFVGQVGGTDRSPIHRYRYGAQQNRARRGDNVYPQGGNLDGAVGTVVAIDQSHRNIDFKKRGKAIDSHPTSVFLHSNVRTEQLADALYRLGQWVTENGVDASGPCRAGRDLLLNRGPRLRTQHESAASLRHADESGLAAGRRLALELDGGTLAIQGPPGSGKTYTGARMICELVRAGKKVGITATSHKVIRNLLDGVVGAASEENLTVACIQKVSGNAEDADGGPIRETTRNGDIPAALADGSAQVAAGTAWLWSREELTQAVDVLFVDEAGQMSLANVLVVAQSARNIVLLGDPQQLEQPIQGSHPEGTQVSALEHLLQGAQTMPDHRGLFLTETWRLHPAICKLTSEIAYEGRLGSRPNLEQQAVVGATPFAGAGLWLAPVEHQGNRNNSPEEVERVAQIHRALTSGDISWTNQKGVTAPITPTDILIVAPYNAQVTAIGERLPNALVGTVDRFQGQEAPVVIYSLATSSPEEAPRGMDFLYSLNRLNVATSRARCVCILVASPRLFSPECRTPRQIRLANAFCRYRELATIV